jgi:dCMP deaminase
MSRIDRDEWGLRIAETTALRGTCLRRQVGCFLVDRRGNELSMGFNGVASGMPHCNEVAQEPQYGTPRLQTLWEDNPDRKGKRHKVTYTTSDCIGFIDRTPNACPGADAVSGTKLDACEAIHAEQNAIAKCRDTWAIDTCYVTVSPCVSCVKMLMNTSCRRIVFRAPYAHDEAARALWQKMPREWLHLKKE